MVAILAVVWTSVLVIDRVTTRDGDKVLVLGDSITEWGTPALETELGGRFRLQVIGRGGFRAEQLQPEAVAAAATGPTQVILNAGTNDALQHQPPNDAAASIEQMVALFPEAECVHVVTLNTHMRDRDGEQQQGAEQINDALRELLNDIPTCRSSSGPRSSTTTSPTTRPMGTLTPDTVHPGPEGERVLLGAYDDALQRCGRPWRVW